MNKPLITIIQPQTESPLLKVLGMVGVSDKDLFNILSSDILYESLQHKIRWGSDDLIDLYEIVSRIKYSKNVI